MKAILLAAGLGTRLLPLTKETPKCLVPVNGVPMMEYWFRLFRKAGIDEVLINLNHLPEKVSEWVSHHAGNIRVTLSYEEQLLGSLGTILANRSFFAGDEACFIFYSDNLTNIDLRKMLQFHRDTQALFTMGLFRTNNPRSCGIAEMDGNHTIIDFVEKPAEPRSDLANAGIYILSGKVFDVLPPFRNQEGEVLDVGFHLLPKLVNRMKGYPVREYLLDIGTHENLKLANDFVRKNPELFK